MQIRDILIALTSYPNPSPTTSIESAVRFPATLGSHITAVTFEAQVTLTRSNHWLTNLLIDLPEMLSEERFRSVTNAKMLLETFEAAATRCDVSHDQVVVPSVAFQVPDILIDHARLRDLTIILFQEGETIEQWYAEAVIFGSGRPVLILPATQKKSDSVDLGTVTVAWDFSRAAARALSDSLHILEKARQVRVVTVINEKTITTMHSHEQLAKHFARHNIKIEVDIVDAKGQSIGRALSSYLEASKSSLLVMGAYGHSRAQEFVLGGATRTMLANPPVPLLVSH